jgi:hypothetical protein
MTDIDIIRMAKEAGGDDWGIFKDFMPEIEKLSALAYAAGAAAEREACARLCEQPITEIQITDDCSETIYKDYKDCAEFIRARGQE